VTPTKPIAFADGTVSGAVSDYLETIEISGLALAAGQYVKLKLKIDPPAPPRGPDGSAEPPASEWRTFLIVADDPPGDQAAVITTLYSADPGGPLPPPSAPISSLESRPMLSAMLGIGLAPRGTFSLTTMEDPTGALNRPEVHFVAVYASTRWLDYLPGVFQQDERRADFLARYLGALFVDGERYETILDGLGDYLVPSRLPSMAAARFLAGWFDIDLDAILSTVSDEDRLKRARVFLARVLPRALSSGTAATVQTWIHAVAEARGMPADRRRRLRLVEGYKMRRLFTLPRVARADDPEPTPLARDWGWLPGSAPLAADPLVGRAFLDDGRTLDSVSLGMPEERDDPVLLQRLLGSRLWLLVPTPKNDEPTCEEWRQLLAPALPAHLMVDVIELASSDSDESVQFHLGDNTILGVTAGLL
jgi:hypothetical protein